MAANFAIVSPKAGEYRWVLTSQGRTLATSEVYRRKGLAQKAIVSFRMTAVNAPVVDTTVPAAKTPTREAARTTGRMVARGLRKSAGLAEKAEKAAGKASEATKNTLAKVAKR